MSNFRQMLPWRRCVIETTLSAEGANQELSKNVGRRRIFGWPETAFVGSRRPDGFHMSRVIGYGNGLLPVVDVRVESAQFGARLLVSMRPNWGAAVVLFMFAVAGGPLAI